jgi:RHS repeat-associated protein
LPNGGYGGTPEYPNFWSAYGNHFLAPNTAVPAGQDQIGFGGKYGYYQDPTGLYLLGCRYYDPINARFLTRDPTGYQAGPNMYAYCEDNPITRSDPEGTDSNTIKYDGQEYERNVVGDADNLKGYPHWEVKGGKLWIGNDGVARNDVAGTKTVIKNKNVKRQIEEGTEKWRNMNVPGKPVTVPQENRFQVYNPLFQNHPANQVTPIPWIHDPPLKNDPANLIPLAVIFAIADPPAAAEAAEKGGLAATGRALGSAAAKLIPISKLIPSI